jgi:hypothetical protein
MTTAQALVWIGGLVVVLACVVIALVAARRPRITTGLAGLVPIAVAGLALAFRIDVPAPASGWAAAMALAFGLLGIVGGGPATTAVLELARRGEASNDPTTTAAGGSGAAHRRPWFLRRAEPDTAEAETPFLRGGAAIGYLERIAVVVAIAVGHLEIVAAVIAVKGLGRFSELDNDIARERFIIGTLASLTWAGACAAVVVLR